MVYRRNDILPMPPRYDAGTRTSQLLQQALSRDMVIGLAELILVLSQCLCKFELGQTLVLKYP